MRRKQSYALSSLSSAAYLVLPSKLYRVNQALQSLHFHLVLLLKACDLRLVVLAEYKNYTGRKPRYEQVQTFHQGSFTKCSVSLTGGGWENSL